MPTPQLTPQLLLQSQLKQLQEQTKAKEQLLPKGDPVTYAKQIQQLQVDFDKKKKAIVDLGQQFDQISTIAQAGLIPQENADEAMWRMLVPTEVAKAMFPKQTSEGAPLSPSALTGKPMTDMMTGFMNATPMQGNWSPTPNHFKQEDLTKQYVAWRDLIGYDQRPSVQQNQLDTHWDRTMQVDPRYKWNPANPEVAALRSKGQIAQTIANKYYRKPSGTTPVPQETATPFSQHIEQQINKQKPAMVEVTRPDGARIRVPKGEWETQKSAAISEGWKE